MLLLNLDNSLYSVQNNQARKFTTTQYYSYLSCYAVRRVRTITMYSGWHQEKAWIITGKNEMVNSIHLVCNSEKWIEDRCLKDRGNARPIIL
jgi:hypothetical protein